MIEWKYVFVVTIKQFNYAKWFAIDQIGLRYVLQTLIEWNDILYRH